MKFGISLLFILLTATCFCQLKDTLYFYNNTKLVGGLKRIRLGIIKFNADGLGDLNIKYNKVRTIVCNSNLYRVETITKKIYNGSIESSDMPGCITVQSGEGSIVLMLSGITEVVVYGQNWSSGISGLIGAGYSYTKSSGIGRFNLNGRVDYIANKFDARLEGSLIITSDSARTYKERESLGLTGNYHINKSWYYSALLSYQKSIELGLQGRWQQGLAAGYKFLQRQGSVGKSITGIVVNEEKDFNDQKNTYLEWVLQGNYNFYSFENPNISLTVTQTLYVSLSQQGRYRYDGDISSSWEIIKDFSFSLSFYHNYDHKSPATQAPKIDYGFVAGLNYKF